jgi:histone deacetylase 1/2
LNG